MTDTQRKSFLFATFEGGGSVTPALGVVEQLVARGHDVRVMSDACNRPESEASGARFVPWTRAPSKADRSREFDTFHDWAQATPFDGIVNVFNALLTGPALAFAEDVRAELAREPADLVVANEMLFGVHAGCESLGQKLALLAVNIHLFPPEGVPPLGPGLHPARTAEEKAEHEALRASLREALDGAGLPALNWARAALGLDPIETLEHQYRHATAMMLATSRAFDFAPDPVPAGLHCVGPVLAEPKWAAPWATPFAADDDRPLALVSFSTTFQNHAGDLQRVIDAMADLPMRAVVTLGGSIRASELAASDNVVVVDSAPHHQVMGQAALVVSHGGHGTVMKALANGCPLLVMPHGRDQNDNAARVEARGAGLMLPPTAEVAEIRAALARLLADPSFTERARALGAEVVREAHASPVIGLLEGMAGARSLPGTRCAA